MKSASPRDWELSGMGGRRASASVPSLRYAKPGIADETTTVYTEEAKAMARQLASQEALFAGTSSGANGVAAIWMAKRLGAGHTVVTLLVDSGLKYLTTDLYTSP